MSTVSSITAKLRRWYTDHKRDLPWRHTRDPYRIWLSEVILQQTRVDQGMAYWQRFVERFPTVRDLASTDEGEVLRLWQGLGYYSRARNLLKASRQVLNDHNGQFPATYEELKGLKGVGEYTAAAIGSICFDLVEPVVDGNVYRVLARVFGVATQIDSGEGKRKFRALAARLMDKDAPGDHNQAMMELGATICTPKRPRCPECPLRRECMALREGQIDELPVKAGRTKVRVRHFNYLFVPMGDRFYLRQRTGKDIWQNMYELPLIETEKAATRPKLLQGVRSLFRAEMELVGRSEEITHILSHQRIKAVFWELKLNEGAEMPADWIPVSVMDMERYAVPRLIDRWLAMKLPVTEAVP